QRVCIRDALEFLPLGQTSREFNKPETNCCSLIAEVASKAHSPPFPLLRQDDAKAPIRPTCRDNSPQFAMQVFRPTTVKPSFVADIDLNLLLTRLGISQCV